MTPSQASVQALEAVVAALKQATEIAPSQELEYIDQTTAPIPKRSFFRAVRSNEFPVFKDGRRYLCKREDLLAWLKRRRVRKPAITEDAGKDSVPATPVTKESLLAELRGAK